jgi:putative membrane protein (TIGR04086 family)
MNNVLNLEKNKNAKIILKGFLISIIITLVLLFIYATILVKTSVKETTITPVIMAITGVSILIGSSISCIKTTKNGFINGFGIGIVYFITIYLLSSIIGNSFALNIKGLEIMLLGTFCGGIGGIVGVNIRK